MATELTRRSVLAGFGATAGLGAVTRSLATPASALRASDPARASQVSSLLPAPAPGLQYLLLDGLAFFPEDPSVQSRTVFLDGYTTSGPSLNAPFAPPVGSVLRELAVACRMARPPMQPSLSVLRRTLAGGREAVLQLTITGFDLVVATAAMDEAVDGSATYCAEFAVGGATPAAIIGLRIGFLPPAQAFVPLPSTRVLDSRETGGKIGADEERIVGLQGVPGFAHAAVLNATVTDTEGAGFVAVFPADSAWPGNSSVNWSTPNQNLANSVITAVDSESRIRVRGGVNPTHVVIDLLGYLL